MGVIPPAILKILEAADTDARPLPPTVLYCEGWMLRLVLHAAAQGIHCLPFDFAPAARWFSEASLYTAFAPDTRTDPHGEHHTRADGVVGHFRIRPGTKTGLELTPDASQFVVLEAKIGSRLSPRVAHGPGFDQAARYVACIAQTLSNATRTPDQVKCGFFVIAPAKTLDGHRPALDPNSLRDRIGTRIQTYSEPRRSKLGQWKEQYVEPLLKKMSLDCWSWERSLEMITEQDRDLGAEVKDFYKRTLYYAGIPVEQA